MAEAVTWIFEHLRQLHYGVILADPNWKFSAWGKTAGNGKGPERHYSLAPLDWIKSLPVHMLAADDCVCVLWATQGQLDDAIEVLEEWGFVYKTAGAWGKRTKNGKWGFGTGYIFRSAAEFYVVGTIGNPRQAVKNVRNFIEAPLREHSRKPDEMHENLERMYPGVPKCELFSRGSRSGWDHWGNEVGKYR